jgi:ribosomal protein S25
MMSVMPQKRSLKQIERQQSRRDGEKQDKGGRVKKTIGSLDIPDVNSEELMDQLRRMKAITPTGVAISFNIKVSMAKRLLEELRGDRVIDLVSRSHNLKVYALTAD